MSRRDTEDLEFIAKLNAEPAVQEAQKSGEKIAKALAVKTENPGIKKLQKDLATSQVEASKLLKTLGKKASVRGLTAGASDLNKKIRAIKQEIKSATGDTTKLTERLKMLEMSKSSLKSRGKYTEFKGFNFDKAQAELQAYNTEQEKSASLADKINTKVQGLANSTKAVADAEQKVASKGQAVEGAVENTASNLVDGQKAAKGLEEELKNVGKNADKSAGEVENLVNTVDKVDKQIDNSKMVDEVEKSKDSARLKLDLDADVANMEIAEVTRYLEQLKAKIKEIKTYWKETGYQSDSRDAEFNKTNAKIEEAKGRIKELQGAFRDTGNVGATAMQQLTTSISVAQQSVRLFQNVINGVIGLFKKMATTVRSVAKKIWNIFKSLGKTIHSFFSSIYKSISKDADKAFSIKNLRRALNMLTKYVFGFRSFFFLYRRLRKGIQEGLENLVQFESEINETNIGITALKSSLLYLKNAWAAAFAPIINTVYPILVALMDLLARVGNTIARFIAALTGQTTVLQALKVDTDDYAESLKKLGGGADDASKKQDELNDRLAAFDDLNVLGRDPDKNTTGSGGGGGGSPEDLLNVDDMFERINTPFNKLAEMIRNAWETGDAFGLGKFLALGFAKALDKAYEWLTGEGEQKVLKIANFLGTLIDGMLSVDDLGTRIGRTLSAAFILAFKFVNKVITPKRLYNIGRQIALALNEAIPKILPELGKTLGNLFKSAITGWFGFLSNADFRDWGASIGKAINQFLEQMSEEVFITTAKGNLTFAPKVEALGNGWEILGQNITLIAQGMLDALAEALRTADWKGIGEGIGELLANIDWEAIWEGLTAVWDGLKEALSSLWEGFKEANPELAKKLEPLANALSSIVDRLPEITDAIGELLDNIDIETIAHWIEQIPDWIITIANVLDMLLPILEKFVTLIADNPELTMAILGYAEYLKTAASILGTVGMGVGIANAAGILQGGLAGGAAAAGAGAIGTQIGTQVTEGVAEGVSSEAAQEAVETSIEASVSKGAEAGLLAGFGSKLAFASIVALAIGAFTAATNQIFGEGGIIESMPEFFGSRQDRFGSIEGTIRGVQELINPISYLTGGVDYLSDKFSRISALIGRDGITGAVEELRYEWAELTGDAETMNEIVSDIDYTSTNFSAAWSDWLQGDIVDSLREGWGSAAESGMLGGIAGLFTGVVEEVTDTSTAVENLNDLTSRFGDRAQIVAERLKNGLAEVSVTITEGQRDMAEYYANIGRGAQEGFGEVQEHAQSAVMAASASLDEIPNKFAELKGSASAQGTEIKNQFSSTFTAINSESSGSAKIVQDNFTLASDNIKTSFIGAWEEIKKSVSEGGSLFVALSDGMGNTVKSLLNGMIDGINVSITKPLQDISNSFNILRGLDVDGKKPFAGIPVLRVPTIPRLAQGAVIPPNREFMAVLGDQKSGTNIEAPLDTIRQAVGEEFAPYADAIVNAVMQVVQAVNNKPVLSNRDIGRANAQYESQQRLIRGTML